VEVITIRMQDHFTMPRLCCACGAPSGTAKLKASGVSRAEGRFVNLFFPVCDQCATVYHTAGQRRRRIFLVGVALSLVLCVVAFVLSSVVETGPDTFLDSFLGGLMFLAPAVLILTLAAQWLLPIILLGSDARKIYRRVGAAVHVKRYDPDLYQGGYITLAFANEEFADQFQRMNIGVVGPGRQG